MLIKEMNEIERPRERLIKFGPASLKNEELLAIILKTGRKGKSAKDLAIELIDKLGGIDNFKNINLNNLRNMKGIGNVKKLKYLQQ